MKWMIVTRDWKGRYDNMPKGWKVFAGEDKVNTGQDCFATVLCKGTSNKKLTGQEVYDIWESLLCGETEEGYALDAKNDKILIEV